MPSDGGKGQVRFTLNCDGENGPWVVEAAATHLPDPLTRLFHAGVAVTLHHLEVYRHGGAGGTWVSIHDSASGALVLAYNDAMSLECVGSRGIPCDPDPYAPVIVSPGDERSLQPHDSSTGMEDVLRYSQSLSFTTAAERVVLFPGDTATVAGYEVQLSASEVLECRPSGQCGSVTPSSQFNFLVARAY
jgi:hypothetical protein